MLLLQERRDVGRNEERQEEKGRREKKRKLASYTHIANSVKTYKNVTAFEERD